MIQALLGKKALESKWTVPIIAVSVLGVIVIGYYGIARPILKSLNIIDSKEDKKGEKAFLNVNKSQALSPQLYIDNKNRASISSSTANSLATQIYDGKWGGCGGVCDDEGKAVGAIQNAGSKINISYIANQFNLLYGRSMESYMQSYLEPQDWLTIENYINSIK